MDHLSVAPWFPPGDVSSTPTAPPVAVPPAEPAVPDASMGPFEHLRRQAVERPIVDIYLSHLGLK